MGLNRDHKIEEFRNAGHIMSAVPIKDEKPEVQEKSLVGMFAIAHGEREQREHTNLAQQVREGVVDINQLSIRVSGAEMVIIKAQLRESDAKKNAETQLFLATLRMLEDQIYLLDKEIERMEDGFKAQYGDSWREIIALKVLGEDDMPQREEGESLEDYRARVEQALMDEMLDENGDIKPKYANDPEHAETAKWAKSRWDRQQAQEETNNLNAVHNDPDSTPEEKSQARSEASNMAIHLAERQAESPEALEAMKMEREARAELNHAAVETAAELDGW